jgi:hypothetical protein
MFDLRGGSVLELVQDPAGSTQEQQLPVARKLMTIMFRQENTTMGIWLIV